MAHGEALRIRVIKLWLMTAFRVNEAALIFRVGIASAIRWVTRSRRRAALRLCRRRGPAFCAEAASELASWSCGARRII